MDDPPSSAAAQRDVIYLNVNVIQRAGRALTWIKLEEQTGGERDPGEASSLTYPYFCLASAAPAPSALSFASAMSRRIGAMPQLVQAMIFSFGATFVTSADHLCHLLGRLDLVSCDINHADQQILTFQQ